MAELDRAMLAVSNNVPGAKVLAPRNRAGVKSGANVATEVSFPAVVSTSYTETVIGTAELCAKLSNSTTRTRTNSDDANLTNLFGLEKALPSSMDPSSLVKMGSDTSNVGTGAIQRSEAINLTLAALVAQVLPNGNLVIDGHQQMLVNNEMRDMRVSGIVRREDITQDNTVNLTQIAEARISYGGKGTVSDVQQPRYGSQLFDIIMPW